jgi:phage repressor protein C with HTH and peptisase S24 domain
MLNMVLNFKQFMFDKSLRQNDLAQILGESQSVISLFVNGKRLPMKRHIDALEAEFGADTISQYMIETEEYRDIVAKQVPATIVPAEVVEEIKEEVAQAESVPILSEDITTATDIDIRSYIDENGDELERINPSQMLQQADLAERVMRTSMLPTFAPGDIIFIRFMKDKAKLIDGETYYFDLKSLPTMIRKVKIEGDKLRLIAQNPNFGDIVTTRADIVSVAKIVGLLRMTFTDFYSDIDEARKQKEEQISNMIESHTTQVDSLIKEISKFGERENRLIDILEKKL